VLLLDLSNPNTVKMSISPLKATTRGGSYDTSSIAIPTSPQTTRTVRRLQSHQQLSSNSPSLITQQRQQQQLHALTNRESREQLQPPMPNSGRTRANSDAPIAFKKPSSTRRLPASATHNRKSSLEVLLRDGPPSGNIEQGLSELRYQILSSRVEAGKEGMSDYRCYLWLALLNVAALPTDEYLDLVHRGRSPAYQKISDDTFRTLATDTLFKRRVTDASITRVLNATAWKLYDAKKAASGSSPTVQGQPTTNDSALYVQGMNVLSAPFLYAARSETEAFSLFHAFLTRECPGYIRGAMEGVHKGLALVDKCLAIVNPTLSQFLQSKMMPAEIYAFPSVLTFCACTPPLPEVLHLWDFLFAYGPHLNILCIVAQLLLLKDTLLASPRYNSSFSYS
jgi:cell cycle arrest protein BUB2